MARARAQSLGESLKTPHTVSLKVLRLTRPSFAQQFPLPANDPKADVLFPPSASLAYPHSSPLSTDFILSPLLTLPESFQTAYVGEVFSCTLSANNELPASDTARSISGLRVAAEIISPSTPSGIAVDLEDNPSYSSANVFKPRDSVQKVLRYNLQEEGDHTLAVTVTYTETSASAGKVRTFRKLYQFTASNLISVRTKAGDISDTQYALEAQLENLGDQAVTLENVKMNAKAPFLATSLNGDKLQTLAPRDIVQCAFLLEKQIEAEEEEVQSVKGVGGEKRFILGMLSVQWRSGMGDRGSISTGWLTGKKR